MDDLTKIRNLFYQNIGRANEKSISLLLKSEGYEVHRSPIGHDFIAIPMGVYGKQRGPPIYVEVKTGKSKLSKKQKEMQEKYGNRYVVVYLGDLGRY